MELKRDHLIMSKVLAKCSCGVCVQPLEEWEAGICEGCGTDDKMKLSDYQKEIMRYLKKGGCLRVEISGLYYRGKLLRIETEEALRATGELKEIKVAGKRRMQTFLVIKGIEQ